MSFAGCFFNVRGGENMELSEVMKLSQEAIAGQCERR